MEFIKKLQDFCQSLLIEKRYSSHTVLAYKNDILQFNTHLSLVSEKLDLDNLNYNNIRSWIVEMSDNSIANRSINRKITSVRTYCKYLQKHELLTSNPCDRITSLKIPKRLPQYAKKSELNKLYDIIINDESSFLQRRDFTLIELMYNTGIRKSEIIELKLDQVNLKTNTITVIGKGRKERQIPLGTTLVQNIETYILMRNSFSNLETTNLFVSATGNKLYPKAVYNIVKKYLSLLTTVEKRSPHTLRHSFATHLMNEGAELNAVKKLLGHSSLAATQVYTHNSIEALKDIYKNAHPKGT